MEEWKVKSWESRTESWEAPMFWIRGICKGDRENRNEIAGKYRKTVCHGGKKKKKDSVLRRKMWTTELNSTERSKKRKAGPPCYFLNLCFPIFLSAVGCPWLNSEVWCSYVDVTPLISHKLAVIRATPVEWFDLSPDGSRLRGQQQNLPPRACYELFCCLS